MKRTLAFLLGLYAASHAIDAVVVDKLKDALVNNDVVVCLDDVLFTKNNPEADCGNNVDIYIDNQGKLTDRDQDTTTTYDLLIRIDKRGFCNSGIHIVGVDNQEDAFNRAFIENSEIPGINLYKAGLTSNEVDSLGSELFCLPEVIDTTQIVSTDKKDNLKFLRMTAGFNYTLDKPGTITLEVYDAKSRLVRTIETEHDSRGNYTLNIPNNLSSGVYFTRFRFDDKKSISDSYIIE